MIHRLLLVTALAAACSRSPETEVQAAEPPAAPAPDARVPEPSAGPAEALELPYLRERRTRARSREPEMLRAPADWRATPRGLPAYLADRLAGLEQAFDDSLADVREGGVHKGSRLYTAPMPNGLLVHWYLVQAATLHPGTFTVFVEDRATGRMTAEPVVYTSNWLAYGAPEPYFVDLDGDGTYEVRLQDLFHNGTSTNVYVDAFWEVGPDLELTRVLTYSPEDDPLMMDGDMSGILRRLRFPEGGGLALDVKRTRIGDTNESRDVGRSWLERDPATGTWSEAERLLLDPDDVWNAHVATDGGSGLGWLPERE